MTANSIIEYILVFFGWIMNNALWDIISGTGLYLLPLVFKCAEVWLKTWEEGFDEGNKGMLLQPRMEHALYVPYLVILFCVIPVAPVNISTMKFDSSRAQQCHVSVATPQSSGYSQVVSDLGGSTAQIPVWWYLVHRLSKGTTQAMIASIPCGGKIRQIRFEVQHSQLRDPVLIQELQDFSGSCYSRAYYRLKSTNQSLTDKTINSVSWIGSDYFLDTAGYYDTYTSKQPRRAWPWNEKRDAGYANTGDGGYPTCKEWWSDPKRGLKDPKRGLKDPKRGLKDRVLASLPSRVKADFQLQNVKHWQELALRWLVSPRNVSLSDGGETYSVGSNDNATGFVGNLTRLATTVGVGMKQFEALPGFDALKQALPIVQALLEMMVIIVIPVLLMFSAYDPKTIVTITFALFALMFISFWWEVAGWLDDQLLTIMYGARDDSGLDSGVPFANFVSSVSDGWIMNLVLGVMYLLFPMTWMGMFSWVGYNVGSVSSRMLEQGIQQSKSAGEQGGNTVKGTATSAISKGKKLGK